MAVATYTDVGVALGRAISTQDEQDQIEYWLDGIELLIGSRLGDVGDLDQDMLKFVETEAVVARVNRAAFAGTTSISVAVDDGTVTRRMEGVSASDVTDDWYRLLDPSWGSGAFSVRPSFEADTSPWVSWE